MAYVPIDYSQVYFDEQGRPYWMRSDGQRVFIPPLTAMTLDNPRAVEWARSMGVYRTPDGQVVNQSAPGGSFLRERGHWDSTTGQWKQDLNMNNLVSLGV